MLIDEVDITIAGGHGGRGKVSFQQVGPDGGNGGKGGNVYLSVTSDLKALNQFSSEKHVAAPDGEAGASHGLSGKKGSNLEIRLPIGTSLLNKKTGEVIELNDLNQNILICKGGLGGRGNRELKSSTNRSPKYAQPGLPGERKDLKLILRYLADFGLIGLPNSGKSSLLNELTNAHAVVGDYPFTTLEANLGVTNKKIIADIPGLIEGASKGKGLGIKFLKHIEKVEMLLHCIAADSVDTVNDYHTVNKELEEFDEKIISKKRMILLTKSDLVDKKGLKKQIKKLLPFGYPIHPISIHDEESINNLKNLL